MSRRNRPQKPPSSNAVEQSGTAFSDAGQRARPSLLARLALIIVVTGIGIGGVLFWTWESPQSLYTRAKGLLAKQPEQAERLAELAIAGSGGQFPAAQLLQCRALAATNQWDAALGGFSLIRDFEACDPEELAELGAAAFGAGQFQLAERALEAARTSPHPPSRVFEILVPWRTRDGYSAEALNLCREWQRSQPQAALAWSAAADLEAENLDPATAISDYQQALNCSPPVELEQHIRGALVRLYVSTGNVPAAREQLDLVQKSGSQDKKLQLLAVEILRMEGQADEALAEINRFIDTVEASAEALKQRGILYLDRADYSQAIRDLQQAVTEDPYDKAAHIKLAQAYQRSGQQKLAATHIETHRRLTEATNKILEINRKLQTDPDNEELRKQLQDLSKEIGLGGNAE